MYGFEYLYADNEQDLEASLSKLWKINNSPSILEVKTPSIINDTVLSNYFKNL
jgi:2-succinyl-5-enolpyruvyl-6-hydroxy-3-cyclohexene-1-carboxylate synthase